MRKYAIIFILMVSVVVNAQDTEIEMADKACECLRAIEGIIENDARAKCISNALVNVMATLPEEEKLYFDDYINLKTSMMKISEILTVTCYENGEANYQELENKYYGDSENEISNSFYITTQNMMQQGKYDLAVEGLEIAVKNDSSFVKAYDHLGVSYRNLEDYEKSISVYKKSLKIFPLGKKALSNLALTYAINKDYDNSSKYYQRMIDVHTTDPEGYYGISKNYLIAGKYELGMENICIAHRMYVAMDSDYQKDSEQIIAVFQAQMKKDGKERIFKKLAKKNNIKIN